MAESDEAKTTTAMTLGELILKLREVESFNALNAPIKVRTPRSDGWFRAVIGVSVEDGYIIMEVL